MEQREESGACSSYPESRQRKAAIKREQCQTRLSTAEREQARPTGQRLRPDILYRILTVVAKTFDV